MMKRKKINYREHFKNYIIILEVVLLLFLVTRSLSYGTTTDDNLFLRFFSNANNTSVFSPTNDESAFPTKIAIGDGASDLYAVQFNDVMVKEAYNNALPYISTAFENISDIMPIPENDYQEYIKNPIILIEYDSLIPFELISSWFGREINSDTNLSYDLIPVTIAIVKAEDGDKILIRDAVTFGTYLLKTTLGNGFSDFIASVVPNDSFFAVNNPSSYDNFAPETIISASSKTLPLLTSTYPTFADGSIGLTSLLEAFYYDPYTAKSSTIDDGGKIVFGENFSTLSADNFGSIIFEAQNIQGGILLTDNDDEIVSLSDKILFSQTIISQVLQSINSSGEVLFKTFASDGETGNEILVFSINISGVPVNLSGKEFATFEFSGNSLTYCNINLEHFLTSSEITLMKLKQVNALASDISYKGLPTIFYAQAEDGTYIPQIRMKYPLSASEVLN